MRTLLVLWACLGIVAATPAADATGRVVKVLPFYMDLQGRTATSPSLFDRDAYQAYLRDHTNEISAVRFDVLWKGSRVPDARLKLAVELRGIGTNGAPRLVTLETNLPAQTGRHWTALPLAGADYQNFGWVVAWRTRLWDGRQLLDEQKSFLW